VSKKRKNAGEGYGYMFSGAFKKKADAVRKEGTRKGSFVKGVMTQHGHRYVVMTPRTNPRKKKAPKVAKQNPSELMVMAANPAPQDRELVIPAGVPVTIRINPTRSNWMTSARTGIESGIRESHERAYQQQQRTRRKATRAGEETADKFYREQRKGSRARGKASKVFHELFSQNPAAICGHMISGEPCTRKPGHRGPHLPQGATMRPKSRLRRHWQPNPSAAVLHEEFTGKAGKWMTVYDEPHMNAGDYAQLGELLALYFKPVDGGQVQVITFAKNGRPCLVADESARQIYFVGGDQGLPFPSGTLGECKRIDYKQRKEHVSQPELDEWRHEFGEESGIRPTLVYDANMERMWLSDGDYRIQREGIVN